MLVSFALQMTAICFVQDIMKYTNRMLRADQNRSSATIWTHSRWYNQYGAWSRCGTAIIFCAGQGNQSINSLRPRQFWCHFADNIFKCIFLNIMWKIRWRFHWGMFLGFELTIFQHWFRSWLGTDQATSYYLNQWLLVYWRIGASRSLNE